jgi:hypothetical protein
VTDLDGFLDWYRGVAVRKLDGLSRDLAIEVTMPSGTTMLGTVKHLGWDERRWFTHYFLGEPAEALTAHDSFTVVDNDTVDSVVTAYRRDCDRSRQIVADAAASDAPAAVEHRVFGAVTLEWILVHMIEETARHAGHLDIFRELTDGRTGD